MGLDEETRERLEDLYYDIIRELNGIYYRSGASRLSVNIKGKYKKIVITAKNIILYNYLGQTAIMKQNGRVYPLNTNKGYTLLAEFCENYLENLELIKKEGEKYFQKNAGRKDLLDNIKKVENHFAGTIEFDFPESIAPKEITIEEDKGQKIGTINFGGRTIRIITDGDIVLVNKPKDAKTKEKTKS